MWLILLAFAVAHSALRGGGGRIDAWSVSLLALGFAGGLWLLDDARHARRRGLVAWPASGLALLIPAYAALQLIPLPVTLLELISPNRARIAAGLATVAGPVQFAPLSINWQESATHVSRMVGYALVFLLTQRLARRSKNPWTPVLPLMAVGVFEAAWALSQQFAGVPVVSGTYINQNHFSNFLAMALPFLLAFGLKGFARSNQLRSSTASLLLGVASLVAAPVVFTAILFSSSRMGFFSVMGSLLTMSIILVQGQASRGVRWVAFGGLAAMAVLAVGFLPTDQFVLHFTDIPADGRGPIWRDSLSVVRAFPLFGVGLRNYFPALLPFQTTGVAYAWTQAHNDYLQFVAELGLVGFAIPAALVASVLVHVGRAAVTAQNLEARNFAIACVGAITALLLHCLADFNLYVPANAIAFAWILGLSSMVGDTPSNHSASKGRAAGNLVTRSVATLSAVAVVYSGVWLIYLYRYRDDPTVEAALCRYSGICETDRVLAALQRQASKASVGDLPPSQLLAFLRRDPASPNRWCDLGESLQRAGRNDEATRAFTRALELGPRTPYILYRASQFYLATGDTRRALELTRGAVRGDPERLRAYVAPYESTAVSITDVVSGGLPDDPAVARSLLSYKVAQTNVKDAAAVWDWMLAKAYADDAAAAAYVEFLMRNGPAAAAWEAWRAYASWADPGQAERNRVFNGDFERDPAPTRFDWRTSRVSGVAAGFDKDVRHSGQRSLRLVFDSTGNPTGFGVQQFVYLHEGRYRFQAYLRTADVSTDQGPAFTIAAEGPSKLPAVTTRDLRGTNEWTLIEQLFDAPLGGGLIRVSLTRQHSFRLDNLLRGTVWIDQVSITPEPAG